MTKQFYTAQRVYVSYSRFLLPALWVLVCNLSPLSATRFHSPDLLNSFREAPSLVSSESSSVKGEQESSLTCAIPADDRGKIMLTYADQKVTGYVVNPQGEHQSIKPYDIPPILRQMTNSEQFTTFLENAHGKLNRMSNGDVGFSLYTKGLGGGRLHDTAFKGDEEGLTKLLEDPRLLAQINTQDDDGETPLHCAVLSGSLESVRTLLDHNADIIHVNARGITALSLALEKNNIPVAQFLAERLESLEKNLKLKELLSDTPVALKPATLSPPVTSTSSSSSSSQSVLVAAPLVKSPPIPAIAQGYEDIYRRFLKGVLIYRPTEGSEVGRVNLPIMDLGNPLEGTFDLSACGGYGEV